MSLSAADLPSMFPPPTPAMPSRTPDRRRAGEIPLQFRHRGTFRASEFGGALPAPQSSGAGYASSFLLSHYFANCRLLHSNDYLAQRDNNPWIAWHLMQSSGMAGILGFAAMSSH